MRSSCCDHMHKLRLISGGHHHHARQGRHETHVERPGMGRPIGPNQSRPVDGKAHRQPLDRYIVHDLIVPALQESRIDRRKGFHPARRQARAEGHPMLLGNAHIEAALREPARKEVQPRPVRHRRRHRDDLLGSRSASAISDCAKTFV